MLTAIQRDVIGTLLGRKSGPFRSNPGPYRDVINGRGYKVCCELELAGIGKIEVISQHAFIFRTHAMLEEKAS